MITAKPQHAAVNAALAAHRLWVIEGLPLGPMVAISPQAGSLDPADTPSPHPDIGKDHLVFCDGGRDRSPMCEGLTLATPDRIEFTAPYWAEAAPLRMGPLDLRLAKQMGLKPRGEDLSDFDPDNEEHQDIFDWMFPR
jgi:hypothetical protein